ncbi:MAG: cysteine--tRNA ligase [Patescibacteria group bacterium]|nr:cysteine--tRNA ligase [Patescibacteria group bacterium]
MLIYNSLSDKKETFKPLSNKTVKIYVCGITPYDTTHLGHAFTYVFFDTLVRYLKFKDYKIIYTQNVTDIDDDILKKAKEVNQDWKLLGKYWTDKFLNNLKQLNIELPTHYTKATDSIDIMIKIISKLLLIKFAYEKSGNVYFDISKVKKYGSLSKFGEKQMILISKERGGNPNDPLKKNPLDFLLWQKSAKNEPFWKSPWSDGRPGWHIECSAMINKYLGNRIDIHGGGRDLIFPHHESEIAQSESFTGKKPFVKYWMHTAMLLYKHEKMSKSLGNLVMIDDLLKKYSANEIRYVLLSHHYRVPWEYDETMFSKAKRSLNLINNVLKAKNNKSKKDKDSLEQFSKYMDNDFDIPKVLSLILNLSKDKSNSASIKKIMSILGFSLQGLPLRG